MLYVTSFFGMILDNLQIGQRTGLQRSSKGEFSPIYRSDVSFIWFRTVEPLTESQITPINQSQIKNTTCVGLLMADGKLMLWDLQRIGRKMSFILLWFWSSSSGPENLLLSPYDPPQCSPWPVFDFHSTSLVVTSSIRKKNFCFIASRVKQKRRLW